MIIHKLSCLLLLLVSANINAQNDNRLYNRWELANEGMSWLFDDRPGDDVDKGTHYFDMPPSAINEHCSCKVTFYMDFDWIGSNGNVSIYNHLNNAFLSVKVISSPGASEQEINYANENCTINANKALVDFKRTFSQTEDYVYYINGNILNLGGTNLTAVYPVNSLESDTKNITNGIKESVDKSAFKNGFQEYTWADGAHYEGEWKDDKRHGKGTYTAANGNTYAGDWENDVRHGQGTFTWTNGNIYTGAWVNNGATGFGTLTRKNGEKYIGEWSNLIMEGQGVYSWPDGSTYSGQWKNDQMDGHGTFTNSNGVTQTGEFKEGVFIH